MENEKSWDYKNIWKFEKPKNLKPIATDDQIARAMYRSASEAYHAVYDIAMVDGIDAVSNDVWQDMIDLGKMDQYRINIGTLDACGKRLLEVMNYYK